MYSGKIVNYYDDIYNKKGYVTESEFIETNSNINKLLDVGCGTGTHLDSLYKSYEQQRLLMSDERKKEKENDLVQKERELQEFGMKKLGPQNSELVLIQNQ